MPRTTLDIAIAVKEAEENITDEELRLCIAAMSGIEHFYRSALIVEKMQDGWVYLKSADLTATNRVAAGEARITWDGTITTRFTTNWTKHASAASPPCTTQRLVGIAARAMSACRFSGITHIDNPLPFYGGGS